MKLEQAKLSYGGKKSEQLLLLDEKGAGLIAKRFQENFWDDSNVLCLDRYLDHTGVFIFQNSFNATLKNCGASLVAQWLRICLPMQGTRVRALVREDPTCRGATKPVRHDY